MLLSFGRASWIEKARQQPDKVKMVLDKVKTDGAIATFESVRAKLDQPITLGYANAGEVLEVGSAVHDLKAGDRVVSNGSHAEIVHVVRNLCARIPDSVGDEHAAFTVVAAIALQGLRLASPTLGETIVVTGLGLIGLLTVQLLQAQGCRVIGIDFDSNKLRIAESLGAEVLDPSAQDVVGAALHLTKGIGVDAVLITAATESNQPVHQGALMCRKRGRIVLVGVAGLELSRDDFYKKELSFQVSCSYGPGRYDPAYEQGGQDYPLPYVRWTEQRNFEAVLYMMAAGRLSIEPLITHRFLFTDVAAAYDLIQSDTPHLGVLLNYPQTRQNTDADLRRSLIALRDQPGGRIAKPSVAFIGAGQFASKVLLSAFQSSGAGLATIASAGGITASHYGRKLGFSKVTTDAAEIFSVSSIDAVVIATRHETHASLVCRALESGKHVYVEKPLAIRPEEIEQIQTAWNASGANRVLMVGFNRRFSPHAIKMRQLLTGVREPKCFVYTINAGSIPADHWTQDPESGGGRIIGEGCHFIDLLRFLAGSPITSAVPARAGDASDRTSITLQFKDGSLGTVHYFGNGHKSFPKERLEVFAGGGVLQLDNFRKLTGYGWPRFQQLKTWKQDKGNVAAVHAFVQAIRDGNPPPIPFEELIEVAHFTFAASHT